jgi:hypothetical protein
MIHYQLRCNAEHEFDGWFADSASFDKQAARGLLVCPICGSASVERALMAPAVPKKGHPPRKTRKPAEPQAPAVPVAVAGDRLPDQVRAMLQRLRAEVEQNCDYVGPAFADEARRMHKGESDRHGIYGETTADEAAALEDEGISVAKIPWVPRADG